MGQWLAENKTWLFEGLGVFLLTLVITFIGWLFKKNSSSPESGITQNMGNNVKGKKVTFKNNKQLVNDKSDNMKE